MFTASYCSLAYPIFTKDFYIELLPRILDNLKHFGIIAAVFDCTEVLRFKLFGTRKYILHRLVKDQLVPSINDFSNLDIAFKKPLDLLDLTSNAGLELDAGFLNEVSYADAIVLSDINSKQLLAYGFFTDQKTAIAGKMYFQPKEQTTYLFKIFVLEHARKKQLLRKLVQEIISFQGAEKAKELIAIIVATNFISRRAFTAMGFKKVFSFSMSPELNKTIEVKITRRSEG